MKSVLLIDESQGINIPFLFYQNYDLRSWGLNPDDYQELEDPDHELYWEVWDDLIANAVHYNRHGKWKLYHNGDLFTYLESKSSNVRSLINVSA